MTTYLGEKAVGIGTVKATIGVTGDVLHDSTLKGNGNTEPLGVDTEIIATTTQVGNLATTLHAGIEAQAEAIAKTRNDFEVADQEIRADMNEKDAELEHMITEHAEELTTLRGNQASLGDQVSNIESKIPQTASDSNPLVTKQQLLDEEMDIRDDYNELVSELQTQITAQAGAIAGKQDELTAGEGIKIENNVISATGGGGSGSANVVHDSTLTGAGTSASPLGLSEAVKDEIADKAPKETVEALTTAVNDIYTGLAGKQDKLTAGENITIVDNVISATGGGASGDYLPLSGGTLTGLLTLTAEKTDFDFSAGAFLKIIKELNNGTKKEFKISASSAGLDFGNALVTNVRGISPGQNNCDVGSVVAKWGTVYANNLNNGANIAIPTTGGTMVVATPPTEDGTYVLKCVMSGGVPTMTWVKE